MTNPLDEVLELEKSASFLGGFGKGVARSFSSGGGKALGEKMVGGAMVAAGTAAVAGIGAAAEKIYNAIDKRRSFKAMMELDPSLQERQGEDPKIFNAAYSSLYNLNPQFAKEPLVAGSYMHDAMDAPNVAGQRIADLAGKSRSRGLDFKPQALMAPKAQEDPFQQQMNQYKAELAPGQHRLNMHKQQQQLSDLDRQKPLFGK